MTLGNDIFLLDNSLSCGKLAYYGYLMHATNTD